MKLTVHEDSSKGTEPSPGETEPTEHDIADATGTHLTVNIDGETVEIEQQIQVSGTRKIGVSFV